ncbi:MAG: OmpA family protein [Alphaproteobacteria bacterium]|nr:OmpA family protein [Alphaproteobacteria bacterium]
MKRVLAALALLVTAHMAQAGDVKGSKDHPLLTRYPESFITEYEKNFNSVTFTTGKTADGKPEQKAIEGQATILRYFYAKAETQPSPLQLLRNYQNAIKAIKGEVVFERLPSEGDGGETTLKANANGKDIWIKVEPDIWSAPTQSYNLAIVEVEAMAQVVSANAMLDALNKDGFIALYINFDTGKSELKSDGQATVKEIAAMLTAAPSLKISIEGHTDNVGTPAANQKLSEARAKAVMDAVGKAGIDKTRLAAKGLGQSTPIADNRTEDGKAKNRRVELVKK